MDLADLIEELERQKKNSLDLRSLLGRSQMILETSGFLKRNCVVVDGAGFEPATSAMPTPRSFQADLPAQLRLHIFKT